jgi:ubiquinone/menaquinone biosynthesis C-methylase UbiE
MSHQKDAEKHERKALHKLVDFRNQRVLEVGCGEGRLTWEYAHLAQRVVGIDPDPEAIHVAHYDMPSELRRMTAFTCASSLNLPFPHETFDIALLSWSL